MEYLELLLKIGSMVHLLNMTVTWTLSILLKSIPIWIL